MNPDARLLDNPIWSAVSICHVHLSEGDGTVRRYLPEVTLLAGMAAGWSEDALPALARMLGPGKAAAFFLDQTPELPPGWALIRSAAMEQMVCAPGRPRHDSAEIQPLGPEDLEEMLALTALTAPGPFGRRTPELGHYYGIRDQGRLAAMAGERLSMPGFTEVSAVCTHPDFRGKGYARTLVAAVAAGIVERGKTPMLHVLATNTGAIRVYEEVGFTRRRQIQLTVVRPEEAGA